MKSITKCLLLMVAVSGCLAAACHPSSFSASATTALTPTARSELQASYDENCGSSVLYTGACYIAFVLLHSSPPALRDEHTPPRVGKKFTLERGWSSW